MKNANARNGHIAIFTAAVIILCGTILCALNNSMFLPVCDCSISTAELITDNGTFLEEQPVLQTSFTAKNYSRHCPRKNAVLVYPVVLMRYRKVRQSYSQSQNHIPYFFAIYHLFLKNNLRNLSNEKRHKTFPLKGVMVRLSKRRLYSCKTTNSAPV